MAPRECDPRPDSDLLHGDARAFAAFYRRHEDAVLGFFLRRTRQADLAADLTAETFARALAGRRAFDPELGDAGAWLFGIARNLLLRSLERGRVEDRARWMASVRLVPSSENRSHGSTLGLKLRRFCNGQKFRYVFF